MNVSGLGGLALGAVAHDQKGICGSASAAVARHSPAAPGLMQTCFQLRLANIQSGVFQTDGYTTDDPAFRVALTNAGEEIIARSPRLPAELAAQPVSRQRGFKMGTAVRFGKADPGYLAFMGPALSHDPELLAGFKIGLAGPQQNLTKGGAGAGGDDDGKILGMPTPVAIGVGVGVLGALGFVAYKFLR